MKLRSVSKKVNISIWNFISSFFCDLIGRKLFFDMEEELSAVTVIRIKYQIKNKIL